MEQKSVWPTCPHGSESKCEPLSHRRWAFMFVAAVTENKPSRSRGHQLRAAVPSSVSEKTHLSPLESDKGCSLDLSHAFKEPNNI